MEEKEHKGLQASIRLKTAEELTQGDFDRFFVAFGEFQQTIKGLNDSDENSRTLRAALKAGWVEWIRTPAGETRTADQVDDLRRTIARWAARLVDAEFQKANTVPNE
jgi:hypothetical protein